MSDRDNYINPSGLCSTLDSNTIDYTCSGCRFDGSDDQYDFWISSNCPAFYSSLLYDAGKYNRNQIEKAQLYTNNLLESYTNYNPITSPDNESFNDFQQSLYYLCTNYGLTPGVCQNWLYNQYCLDEVTSSSSSEYTKWCGCMSPHKNFENVPCSSSCNTSGSIKPVNVLDGIPIFCKEPICYIDGISVNVVGSSSTTTINQICPQCISNCICVIEDIDVDSDININQYCGSERLCYTNIDDVLTQVPCSNPSRRIVLVIGIAIILLVLFLIGTIVAIS